MNNKKDFGLVLSGGGARGFFHLGVIKGLQKLGLEPSEIAGTSIGAVIGLIYASNPKTDFEKMANELDFFKLMQSMILRINKKPERMMENFLKKYIKTKTFSQLKIKTKFNATDINANKEIIFDRGEIFPGLISSISIPGLFPPLKFEDKFLVDGGVINNIPITLIEKQNKILVSDITGPIKKVNEKTSRADVLYTSIALMQKNNSLKKPVCLKNKKIIYLNLDDDKTFILDFRKRNYEYLIDLGLKTLMDKKDKL